MLTFILSVLFSCSIDATRETGFLGRLLNHSRWGNCETKLISVNNAPVLILQAARDIIPGKNGLIYNIHVSNLYYLVSNQCYFNSLNLFNLWYYVAISNLICVILCLIYAILGEELLYDYGDRSKESLEAHPWLAFWILYQIYIYDLLLHHVNHV